MICLRQLIFMLFSLIYQQSFTTQTTITRLQTHSFQLELTIYLLYFNDMPPLVVIYVVQLDYYQTFITQTYYQSTLDPKTSIGIDNLPAYISMICLLQLIFMLFSSIIIKPLQHRHTISPLWTHSFQQELTIYLLYFNDIPPLVDIYVVQLDYYQIFTTQNTISRLQTHSFQQELTIYLLNFNDMPPLVDIYVVQLDYYQSFTTQNTISRLQTHSFQQELTISLLYFNDMPTLADIYVVQLDYYQKLYNIDILSLDQTHSFQLELTISLLYFNDMPPSVDIYVVQIDYYQTFIKQTYYQSTLDPFISIGIDNFTC